VLIGELERVAVDTGGRATLALPAGWTVDVGPPTVAQPRSWDGEPPGVAVSVERDDLCGDALAALVLSAALTRLADPLVVALDRIDDDVRVVVAHRHRGVDVTTVERHHRPTPASARWVVAFTAADGDVPALLPLAHRVTGSLALAA
jgi:hypothetical protein